MREREEVEFAWRYRRWRALILATRGEVCSTFSSFKSHASRKHPNWRGYVNDEAFPMVELPELGPTVHQAQSDSDVRDIPTCNSPCSEQCSVDPLTCPPEQKAAALFLLTFQESIRHLKLL